AHYRAQTVRRGVIVVVDQHGCTNKVFSRWPDAADARIQMTRVPAQNILCVSDAFAPDMARVAQLDFVFADIKILRCLRRTGDDDSVIAGRFEGCAEIAARRSTAERVAGSRA